MNQYRQEILEAVSEAETLIKDYGLNESFQKSLVKIVQDISLFSRLKTPVPKIGVIPGKNPRVNISYTNECDEYRVADVSLTVNITDNEIKISSVTLDSGEASFTRSQRFSMSDSQTDIDPRFTSDISIAELPPAEFFVHARKVSYSGFIPNGPLFGDTGYGTYDNDKYFYEKKFIGEVTGVVYFYIYKLNFLEEIFHRIGILDLSNKRPSAWMKIE